MTKIKLNNYEYEIDNYNRTTNVIDGNISSSAYVNIIEGNTSTLNALLGTVVTDIEISVDEQKIYELHNIDAEITSLNEFLSGNRMSYNFNLIFRFNT